MRRAWAPGEKEKGLDLSESEMQPVVGCGGQAGARGKEGAHAYWGEWVEGGACHRDRHQNTEN